MRSRAALFSTALAVTALALPVLAHAQATGIPFFGPIVPSAAQACAAAWGALVQLVSNIIAFLVTILIVFVAPLIVAYAGFLYVVNPVNPNERSRANKMLVDVVYGVCITLLAWLIVNSVLVALTGGTLSAWTQQLFSGSTQTCLQLNMNTTTVTPNQVSATGAPTGASGAPLATSATAACANDGGASLDNGNGTVQCTDGTTQQYSTAAAAPLTQTGGNACNPALVSSAASDAGYTITSNQAAALACISSGEDACGNGSVTNTICWNSACPNSPSGSASTAAGAYQVLLASNSSCYNNSVCEQAAGATGSLNCSSGFTNLGFEKTDAASQAVIQQCLQAAANTQCSAASAACLAQQNPSLSDWNTPAANTCKSQNGI